MLRFLWAIRFSLLESSTRGYYAAFPRLLWKLVIFKSIVAQLRQLTIWFLPTPFCHFLSIYSLLFLVQDLQLWRSAAFCCRLRSPICLVVAGWLSCGFATLRNYFLFNRYLNSRRSLGIHYLPSCFTRLYLINSFYDFSRYSPGGPITCGRFFKSTELFWVIYWTDWHVNINKLQHRSNVYEIININILVGASALGTTWFDISNIMFCGTVCINILLSHVMESIYEEVRII